MKWPRNHIRYLYGVLIFLERMILSDNQTWCITLPYGVRKTHITHIIEKQVSRSQTNDITVFCGMPLLICDLDFCFWHTNPQLMISCMPSTKPLPRANDDSAAIQCACDLDPSVHWNATGERIFGSQCVSSGLPVCSNYANYHWIATVSSLGANISQCGSSGILVYLWLQWSSNVLQLCKPTLYCHWKTNGR